MVRTGDINNLGFGWPKNYDPFSGKVHFSASVSVVAETKFARWHRSNAAGFGRD